MYDLLNLRKDPNPLRIRWNKKDQFNVENLFVFECQEYEQVMELFHKGIKNKIVASHLLNHASSRSHAIFTVTLEIIDHSNVENVITSKLQLVDLAGSERTSMTGNQGLHVKESIDINRSLFTLRKVISGLADNMGSQKEHVHIPYRDSKLTSLLKQSLGGNSYCLMIACLSPSDRFLEENVTTLNYAKKASYISNEPIRNDDPRVRVINELRAKVEMLED